MSSFLEDDGQDLEVAAEYTKASQIALTAYQKVVQAVRAGIPYAELCDIGDRAIQEASESGAVNDGEPRAYMEGGKKPVIDMMTRHRTPYGYLHEWDHCQLRSEQFWADFGEGRFGQGPIGSSFQRRASCLMSRTITRKAQLISRGMGSSLEERMSI